MKKILLIFSMMFAFVFANAESVTFDFVTNDYGLERKSGTASDGYLDDGESITSDGVTITFNGGWRLWTDGIREYYKTAGTAFTVSSEQNIYEIKFEVVSGATFALDGTADNVTGWRGEAKSVKFINTSSKNAAIVTITVQIGEPSSETHEEPKEEDPEEVVESYVTEIWNGTSTGIPTGATKDAPTEPVTYRSENTGIEYTFYQSVVNSGGYLFLIGTGDVNDGGYIEFILDFNCSAIELTTTKSCSTNAGNKVSLFANGVELTPTEGLLVNELEKSYTIEIPKTSSYAGTKYKLVATGDKNSQFASTKYYKSDEDDIDTGIEEVSNDCVVEYYTIQGTKVMHPDKGIYIKVEKNKVTKVIY